MRLTVCPLTAEVFARIGQVIQTHVAAIGSGLGSRRWRIRPLCPTLP